MKDWGTLHPSRHAVWVWNHDFSINWGGGCIASQEHSIFLFSLFVGVFQWLQISFCCWFGRWSSNKDKPWAFGWTSCLLEQFFECLDADLHQLKIDFLFPHIIRFLTFSRILSKIMWMFECTSLPLWLRPISTFIHDNSEIFIHQNCFYQDSLLHNTRWPIVRFIKLPSTEIKVNHDHPPTHKLRQ